MTRTGALVSAAGVQLDVSSGRTLLALLPLFALLAGLVVYCLVDLVRARSVRYLPKAAWALVIVLGSVPLGALIYLVLGRNRDDDRTGGAHHGDLRPHASGTAA